MPADELASWTEAGAKVLAVFGVPAAIGAWWRRRRARHRHVRELRDAHVDAVNVLVDRAKAEMAQALGGHFTEREFRDRQVVLNDRLLKARKRLWRAQGFPESTDDEARERIAMLRALRMTQRWKAAPAGAVDDEDGRKGP